LAFNFVTNRPDSITVKNTDEKIQDWPYAINCHTNADELSIFVINNLNGKIGNVTYYQFIELENWILFDANGNHKSVKVSHNRSNGCGNKSLTQLAAEGRVYNFLGEPIEDRVYLFLGKPFDPQAITNLTETCTECWKPID